MTSGSIDVVHEHAFPMRWADLDQLNHVNNVAYLDYAAEARALLVDQGLVGDDAGIVETAIHFRRPLPLSRHPVVVRSTVDGSLITQEISAGGTSDTVAEVNTRYGSRTPERVRAGVPVVPAHVRRSDLGPHGAVRPGQLLELFQEARMAAIVRHAGRRGVGRFVVASSRVVLRHETVWRPAPYDAAVWVSRIGNASFEVRCQLGDDETVLAESVTSLVGFDVETQRSRAFTEDERAALQRMLHD